MTALSKAEREGLHTGMGVHRLTALEQRLLDTCDELERERDHCAQNHIPQLSAISGALLDAGCRVGDVDTFAPAIRLLAARVEMLRETRDGYDEAALGQLLFEMDRALNATDDEVRAWQQRREK